jgi:sugar phosphate isomerase/epimerase
MEVGIQISSLKPMLSNEDQVRETFRRVRALGCSTIQLQWIAQEVSPAAISAALAECGLRSVSVQDFYTSVQENFAYYVDLNAVTGGKWLCVSRIPEERKSLRGLQLFADELRQMAERLAPYNQKLCFHPVWRDFCAVSGVSAVEELLYSLPELGLCLDLYHLNRYCQDMPGFIRRWTGRIPMVHFKDAHGETLVPAGQGDIDWSGVVLACRDAGVGYAFAEQERWDRDPYVCLGEAMDWISAQLV